MLDGGRDEVIMNNGVWKAGDAASYAGDSC